LHSENFTEFFTIKFSLVSFPFKKYLETNRDVIYFSTLPTVAMWQKLNNQGQFYSSSANSLEDSNILKQKTERQKLMSASGHVSKNGCEWDSNLYPHQPAVLQLENIPW